jgi:hypothetical protein
MPSGRKGNIIKMTQKEMMVMEKYEGDVLKNEIEDMLESI